ncbi:protein of unknown function [Microlunatus sagamiharensis]|jgi:hypothetical protein|uniref:DUF1905 domain-containing protein n=1 Tax=Microlunatus sagamiharensis TaxID=546874 RepID=A0A1H2LKB9_9ACTN|nr:DUF1905 domain-containing protein [Microlunatus sagamiharensis]SDU81480.1 protein of unknown function [Microlunatus sagamiharensis]
MDREFEGVLFEWRGPAPFHFVAVPEDVADDLREIAPLVSYGWGMVPARVSTGSSSWETALWPKDGGYVVPVRDRFRRAERLEVGRPVTLRVEVGPGGP